MVFADGGLDSSWITGGILLKGRDEVSVEREGSERGLGGGEHEVLGLAIRELTVMACSKKKAEGTVWWKWRAAIK